MKNEYVSPTKYSIGIFKTKNNIFYVYLSSLLYLRKIGPISD